MLTRDASLAPSTEAVGGTSQKLLQLLRKRLRRLLRVTLVLTIGLVVAVAALAIWWLRSLNGLPDIGDPFDVAEFRAFRVPDEQNAFSYFRRASEKLTLMRGMWEGPGTDPSEVKFSWLTANPMWRQWAGENLEAFKLFQQGAEQADASNPAGIPRPTRHDYQLITLAILEANRRQESGDTAGAWGCYRSIVRTITQFRRRGSTLQREWARGASRMLLRRLIEWAAEPRTTVSQLHTALEFVLENEPDPAWDLFAVKSGYLEIMGAMERPIPPSAQREIEGAWTFRLGDMSLSPEMIDRLEAVRRFLLREPERSLCVLRLLCANYLSHAERREWPPRRPAVRAIFSYLDLSYPITNAGTSCPSSRSVRRRRPGPALPPQEVAGWLVGTIDAKLRLMRGYIEWMPPVRANDRRTLADHSAHRELVIMLAREIYRRERGALPASDESLVGTYLKALPDDGWSERAEDQTATPTVE